jgi:hypothetical protein
LEGEELGDPVERLITWGKQEGLSLRNARLLRKNFGWVSPLFREGAERSIAISILRILLASDFQTSAEIAGADLERVVAEARGDFPGFKDCSSDAWEEIQAGAIALPFVFEGGVSSWIDSLRGHEVEVCGGFKERCLDEICMMMEAGGISYHLNEALIFSLPSEEPELLDSQTWIPLKNDGKASLLASVLITA